MGLFQTFLTAVLRRNGGPMKVHAQFAARSSAPTVDIIHLSQRTSGNAAARRWPRKGRCPRFHSPQRATTQGVKVWQWRCATRKVAGWMVARNTASHATDAKHAEDADDCSKTFRCREKGLQLCTDPNVRPARFVTKQQFFQQVHAESWSRNHL